MPRLTPRHFSFNSHLGACPACQGLGTEPFCDPSLIVDEDLPLLPMEGAIRPGGLPTSGSGSSARCLRCSAKRWGFPKSCLSVELPRAFKEKLFHGTGGEEIPRLGKALEGLVPMVERQMRTSESELKKNRLKAFFARRAVRSLRGNASSRPEILGVTITGPDATRVEYRPLLLPACRRSIVGDVRPAAFQTDRKITADLLRRSPHGWAFSSRSGSAT